MDLVDIDKVLDDLELNEDEKQQQAAKSGGVAPARKQLAPIAAETNNNNGGNKAATNSKTFVNITNVFSSLNEYVNVDIEHSIKESAVRPQAENYRGMFDSRSGARENDDEEEEEEEDRTDEDPDGLLTSASSITTSSPSSFSSGPSPGTSSETASFISEEKPRLARDGTGDDDDDETKQEDDGATENDSETTNLIDEDCRRRERIDKDVDVNSGELGLSSLSSCLYNENTSSSLPGLSHDLIKIDALCSMSSSSVQQKDDEPDDESIDLPKPIEQADWPRRAPAANEPYKEPAVIGFGSTMDEISDTELDSILQEIDSDLQAAFKEDPEPQSVAEEAVAADEKELEAPPVAAAPIATTIVAKKIPDLDDDDHENLPNADSFSQASTIEFAESRLQSDFGTDTIGAAAINEEDRSTSSNSGTKNEEQPEDSPQNDEAAAAATVKVIQRPNSLDLPVQSADINSTAGQTPPAFRSDDVRTNAIATSSSDDLSPYPTTGAEEEAAVVCAPTTPSPNPKIGKTPPFWIPDSEAASCMQCKLKFSLLKRRHHCRACGQVLCSACCSQKGRLEFLGDADVRICIQCHLILSGNVATMATEATAAAAATPSTDEDTQSSRPPNPNNPMEYCSMIPPHQQVSAAGGSVAKPTNPISVMVPVGVLKREGVPPKNSRKDKNVIFSDGIRPGCDLTELDDSWHEKGASGSGGTGRKSSSSSGTSGKRSLQNSPANSGIQRGRSKLATAAPQSYLPDGPNELPPIYTKNITNVELTEVKNNGSLMTRLQTETLQFTIQRNFYVYVKIMNLKCCINKTVINFTTHGMHAVGQDEIIILLEHDDSATTHDEFLPKDIFTHLNEIYNDAEKGHPISEMGFSVPNAPNFLGSREHGGFLYIRSTFQCLQEIHLPHAPFLIGILIHRWEMPWAKIFPLRLMLRLGAQYRYYPSPHVSIRGRDSVYAEIAQTIINFLADFRNYSYTLATIRGMYIHMEDRKTSVLIPKNRFEQIVKALNNSSDHILALGGNFSKKADGHLVCIQNMESDCPETHTYSTQAINIQGQPRQVTGASFLVLNGALKTTSGLSGKCSIVEDGLMVQILPAKMTLVRNALKNMQNTEIVCGPVDANESQTEIVSIIWTENDVEFNIGVTSPIDGRKMDGIPSIRVHSGLNYSNASHTIRWTEVFIIQSVDDESLHGKEPIDTSKLSEQIAKSTSTALVSFLDLLAASGCVKIGLRATLHQDNVCYEAGSLNTKLAPLYMNALDNALIPTLHRQIITLQAVENPIILELIFHILDF